MMLSQMLKFAVECDVIPSTVCRAEGGLTLQGMVYKEVNWFCTTQKTPLIFEISDSLLSEVCYGCSLFQETRKNRVMVFMYIYLFCTSCGVWKHQPWSVVVPWHLCVPSMGREQPKSLTQVVGLCLQYEEERNLRLSPTGSGWPLGWAFPWGWMGMLLSWDRREGNWGCKQEPVWLYCAVWSGMCECAVQSTEMIALSPSIKCHSFLFLLGPHK